jgi:calcineurin-like phosphoesterase
VLYRFLMNTPKKLEVAKRDIRLTGAMIEVDESTGKAARIIRIQERVEE